MGASFASIHVFDNKEIQTSYCEFRSFSDGWQTCISDFSDKDLEYSLQVAKLISKQTSSPVLYFQIFDSDYIYFEFLQNGKIVARYSDDEFSTNKNLYGIPMLLGYGDGYKKRLSKILNCDDADEKTELLEEYFGVCLLPFSECFSDCTMLKRTKDDKLYNEFIEKEKAISGKHASIALELVAEYKGKIFWDYFGSFTQKEHCYLLGYESERAELTPVRFCGEQLEEISEEEFNQNRILLKRECDFCKIEYGTTCYAIFNDSVPKQYANKKMKLPNHLYPFGFDTKNRLVLIGRQKICIADEDVKIIAKNSIKGECVDMIGDFVLTAPGDSFCGYEYDPKATVRIYRMNEKQSASILSTLKKPRKVQKT